MPPGLPLYRDRLPRPRSLLPQKSAQQTNPTKNPPQAQSTPDVYKRQRQRELITFCFLAAQGGCEPQLKSHIAANLRLGTGRHTLIAALSTTLPYIGYPRSLNALRCIQEAADPPK